MACCADGAARSRGGSGVTAPPLRAVSVVAFPSEDRAPGVSAASTLDSPVGQRVFGAHLESGFIPQSRFKFADPSRIECFT